MATSIVSYLLEFTGIWRSLDGNFFSPACQAPGPAFRLAFLMSISSGETLDGDLLRRPVSSTCERGKYRLLWISLCSK